MKTMNFLYKKWVLILLFMGAYVQLTVAQKNILQKTISVKIVNQPLNDALRIIGEQGNFSFSYNPAEIDLKKRVTIQVNNLSIKQILDDIFRGQVSYTERKNHIILHKITESKEEANKQIVIIGYIYDYSTNKPIAEASVFEKKTLTAAITDKTGFFKLKLDNDVTIKSIEIRKRKYLQKSIRFTNKQSLEIALVPIEVQQPNAITINKIEHRQIPKDTLEVPTTLPTLLVSADTTFPKEKRKLNLDKVEESFIDFFASAQQAIHTQNIEDTLYRDLQVSLLPFIGTNHTLSGSVINTISFNVLAGYSLGVSALEVGGFANLIRGNVKGVQAAGFGNFVGKDVAGVQGAGFVNATFRDTEGIQASGFANFVGRDFQGIQAAGFVNVIGRNAKNTIQASGFANVAIGDTKGIQASGFANVAANHLKGIQASGFFNYAQIHTRGVQVSLVNYADSSGGFPIGLFSFVRANGYRRLEIGSNDINYTHVVFKSGVQKFYNFLTIGSNFGYANKPLFTLGYGIGTAQNWNKGWLTNADISYQRLVDSFNNILESRAYIFRLDLAIEKKIGKQVSLFVGPSWTFMNAPAAYLNIEKSKLINILPNATLRSGYHLSNWIGFQGGIRLLNKGS